MAAAKNSSSTLNQFSYSLLGVQTSRARRGAFGQGVPGHSVGVQAASLAQLAQKLKSGLPYQSLIALEQNSGLSLETIAHVVQIPRRTLARRKAQGKLTPHESERLFRLALVFEKAMQLFEGDAAATHRWLNSPNKALGGHSPLEMAETEIGAREVEDLVGRTEHGVFS